MRGLLQAPNTELAAACDVYHPNADRAANDLAGGRAQKLQDFRRLLEIKEVDAIMVSTPDHWHSIPTVLGLEAGKHVYVEKPFALTIREGRAMVEAARRTKRILFPGTQHRSAPHIAEAARMVRSGEIGEVSFVRVWNSGNIAPNIQKKVPDSDPPPGLDWDFYLGPSPKAPFNRMRFLTNYRVFSDYAGGYITDLRQSPRRQRPPDHGRLQSRTPSRPWAAACARECRRYLRSARGHLSVCGLRDGVCGLVGQQPWHRRAFARDEVLRHARPVQPSARIRFLWHESGAVCGPHRL